MQVTNFKRYEKGTLQGFFELHLDSGLSIRGMTYHTKDDKRWVAFPSKPYEDKDGEVKYQNLLYIPDESRWTKFQTLALRALDEVLRTETVTDDIPF
jgi:hypothetical protein